MLDTTIATSPLGPELRFALRIASLAGETACRALREEVSVQEKTDSSPITSADIENERIITEAIKAEFPEDGILGEEGATRVGTSGRTWIIDPIDGTRDYVRGTRFWCVLIALERDNESIIGVAHFPMLDETYWAVKGGGAFMNDTALKASTISSIDLCSFSCNGLHHPESLPYLMKAMEFAQRSWVVRACGAIDACMLAAGKVDVWFNPKVAPWDVAAHRVIIEEAGGRFFALDGSRAIDRGTAIACAPDIAEAVCLAFDVIPEEIR